MGNRIKGETRVTLGANRENNWNLLQRSGSQTLRNYARPGEVVGARAKVVNAIRSIERAYRKVIRYEELMKARIEEMRARMMEAIKNGEEERAKIYANEIANLNKIYRNLEKMELVLEQSLLRLKTFLALGDAVASISPIRKDLVAVIRESKDVLPMISEELEDVIESVEELAGEDMGVFYYGEVGVIDSEARKILEEAKAIAQHRIAESLASKQMEESKA